MRRILNFKRPHGKHVPSHNKGRGPATKKPNVWRIPLIGLTLAIVIAALACGESTTPETTSTGEPTATSGETSPVDTPTPEPTSTGKPIGIPGQIGPGNTPTPDPTDRLGRECAQTVIGFPGPIDAIRSVDRIPTGFDPVNSAGCTFTESISGVSLELLRDGERVFKQEIVLEPASEVVGFPLPEDQVGVVPDDMEPGPYDRRIQVTSVDGESMVLISDTIWVFDPDGHPVTAARRALAESLGVDPGVTHLDSYEPVTWSDTSLGCPKSGTSYAQVETIGFKLVFIINTPELWGPLYEYHTNLDGSMLVVCEDEEATSSGSAIEFVMKDSYALGQGIEIAIRNVGTSSYVYSEYYPACRNLKFYDGSEDGRPFERFSGMEGSYVVELPPGLFIIPEETHCDLANESQIRPGEEAVLLTWSQRECVKDKWGCAESVSVKAGQYTIAGRFPESMGSSDPNALSFEKGDETVAEWSFTIVPSEDAQTGSPGSDVRTPTPMPIREWDLEGVHVDGSRVTVLLRVYAGTDVGVTLDGRDHDELKADVPFLEFVFQGVADGKHTIEVEDVVGYDETAEVVVPGPNTSLNGNPEHVTFGELFSGPDRYNGIDIVLTRFYFQGWETTVLGEGLEYSGRA